MHHYELGSNHGYRGFKLPYRLHNHGYNPRCLSPGSHLLQDDDPDSFKVTKEARLLQLEPILVTIMHGNIHKILPIVSNCMSIISICFSLPMYEHSWMFIHAYVQSQNMGRSIARVSLNHPQFLGPNGGGTMPHDLWMPQELPQPVFLFQRFAIGICAH